MTFNDLLVGKGSLKEKLETADCVTGVRKSYTCYNIALESRLGSMRRYHIYTYSRTEGSSEWCWWGFKGTLELPTWIPAGAFAGPLV